MDIIEELISKIDDVTDGIKEAVKKAAEERTCPECFCMVTPENKAKHVAALHADKSPGVDDATA